MDSNTKKSKTLGDYMKEAKPYDENEVWDDGCGILEGIARGLVTMQKEFDEGKYN